MSGVCVVLEQREGAIGRTSWEALAAGQGLATKLGLPVNAALVGGDVDSLAAAVAAKAVGKVTRIEHALLEQYTSDGFSLALEQFIGQAKPSFIVFPHTYQVRDFVPALAARLGEVLIS